MAEITFSSFKKDVYSNFKRHKKSIKRSIQFRVPEIEVVDIALSGSYGSRSPTEESDIDIKVIYRGDLDRDIIYNRLMGEIGIPGVPGVCDIHLQRIRGK